jgi:hypothetical protein
MADHDVGGSAFAPTELVRERVVVLCLGARVAAMPWPCSRQRGSDLGTNAR